MSVIDFRNKSHYITKNLNQESNKQKFNDKEKIARQVLGFLYSKSRRRVLEKIKLELGLQEDTSGDRYSSGYHT